MKLTLPYPPPTNRLYRNFRGRMVLSSEARQYKAEIARLCDSMPLDGAISVSMDIYRPRKAGDLDGRQKCLLDALQGICYNNDSQIIELHARRHDSKENPRVEIEITELKP